MKVKDLGVDIAAIIENNLETQVYLIHLKDAFVQKPDIAHLKPRFEDWRLIKAQALVTGKLLIKDEKLKVEFRLWDLTAAKEITALAFTTTPSNWRRVAHIISDKIYERLTEKRVILIQELFMLQKVVQKIKE